MTPRRELKRSPRCTFGDLARQCPTAIALVVSIWGALAVVAELTR